MLSSGMLRSVTLLAIHVSRERIAFIIRVTRIGELGTTLAVTCNNVLPLLVTANVPSSPVFVTLMMEMACSSETSFL
jgi:hypothetical protein